MDYQSLRNIDSAKSASGGTSLITLYIPSNYAMSLVSEKLMSELSTASNIKNKNVRKDVISALKSAMSTIKSYNKYVAPENGLILCAGESTYCS